MEHARLQDLKKIEKIPTVTLYGLALERKTLMFPVGTLGGIPVPQERLIRGELKKGETTACPVRQAQGRL